MFTLTEWLLQDVADRGATRDDVAMTYGLALQSMNRTDWPKVNQAIIDRWSVSALEYIKNKAWKFAEGRL